jgi:hypothetical protein
LDAEVRETLPADLAELAIAEGTQDDGPYVLFMSQDFVHYFRLGDAYPSDEEIQAALAAHPEFDLRQEVWYLAYPEAPPDFSNPWDEWVTDDEAWEAREQLGADADRLSRSGGWVRFQPSARCLCHAEDHLNRYFVYASREDACADLAERYPRVSMLRQIERSGSAPQAGLARLLLDGDESAMAPLADALEEQGDDRAAWVRSWLEARESSDR